MKEHIQSNVRLLEIDDDATTNDLLKKVEALTLYTLQQKEKKDEQEQDGDELMQLITTLENRL